MEPTSRRHNPTKHKTRQRHTGNRGADPWPSGSPGAFAALAIARAAGGSRGARAQTPAAVFELCKLFDEPFRANWYLELNPNFFFRLPASETFRAPMRDNLSDRVQGAFFSKVL